MSIGVAMNYNRFINPYPELVDLNDTPICNRAKLDTGTNCNYNCTFCYYRDQLHEVTNLDVILERAKKIKKLGATEIDLSGGESSIHIDWFKILDFCNENFEHVSTLSNGYKFANYEFLKESMERGLKEILFSLHGTEREHNKIVGRKNAYRDIMMAIENAKRLDMVVRINCTVTNENALQLDEYSKIITDIHPFELNYLPLNYWSDNKKYPAQDYDLLSKHIKHSIDLITDGTCKNGYDDKIELRVRYAPFCYFLGYESHLYGHYQHIFDQWDWNICWYDYNDCGDFDNNNNIVNSHELEILKKYFKIAKEKINFSYMKVKKCYNCMYFHICDGIEKQYDNKFIDEIVRPVASVTNSKKIYDVTHFIRKTRKRSNDE